MLKEAIDCYRKGDEMDRDKVIKGLEICTSPGTKGCIYDMYESAIECPYAHHGCRVQMEKDAFVLLKEQEVEIRQLKLALDIAKGTCNGIVMEGR